MKMTMAIIRRSGRRSEPKLNDLDRPNNFIADAASSTWPPSSENSSDDINHDYSTSKDGSSSWFGRRRHQTLRSASSSTSSFTPLPSILAQFLPRQREFCIHLIRKFLRNKSPRYIASVVIAVLVFLYLLLISLKVQLVGPRDSIKGGKLGYLIDQYSKDYVRYRTISKWRDEVTNELHIPLAHSDQEGTLLEPRFWPLDVIIKTRPNAALVEMLLREKRRTRILNGLIHDAINVVEVCARDPKSSINITTTVLRLENRRETSFHLLPYWITRSEVIELDSLTLYKRDSSLMPALLDLHKCLDIITSSENYASSIDIELHCMAFILGGMQMNEHVLHKLRPLVEDVLLLLKKTQRPRNGEFVDSVSGGSCSQRVGYAVMSNAPTPEHELRKTSSIASFVSTMYTAMPPNHPAFLCLPPFHDRMGISPYQEANQELSFQSVFANRLATTISHAKSDHLLNTSRAIWGVAKFPCDIPTNLDSFTNCCNEASVSAVGSIENVNIPNGHSKSNPNHYLVFTVRDILDESVESHTPIDPLHVSIEEEIAPSNALVRSKESIQEKFTTCKPGWWCNRCLQTSLYGSFSKCTSVCEQCVAEIICNDDEIHQHQNVTIRIRTTGSRQDVYRDERKIPRVIHQTWFEDITMESYPQLFRLQNTWRASGWDYRFYTDETARIYIQDNYPPRFVAVFDDLIPGAYKADFFRYLVLFKEGGIYVDVDVMLDTHLDSFITSNLAFFAPIDAVGSYAGEQFCLWNGFLGSAPGHPILSKVIEWMVNHVSNRGDMYDMERSVCRYSGGISNIENWKIRAEPSLLLSGPCALGLAANRALGNEPLSNFDTGLLKRHSFNQRKSETVEADLIGDILVLVADKDDLGAFRFSDPERNIIVATTDMIGLSKSPMRYGTGKSNNVMPTKLKPHYSASTKGEHIWGTQGVYADNFQRNEHIIMAMTQL